MNLLNSDQARYTNQYYWLGSPSSFHATSSDNIFVASYGNLSNTRVDGTNLGVRPAISLKPGTVYARGDGSMATPYVVE